MSKFPSLYEANVQVFTFLLDLLLLFYLLLLLFIPFHRP